jgi:hypothetical protein
VPPGLTNVIAIASSYNHNLFLLRDGTIPKSNSPGDNATNIPEGLSNVVAIATGLTHGIAMLGEGPPWFSPAMINRTVAQGITVNLYSPATGAWPISYQWQLNGVDQPGQTNLLLQLPEAQPTQSGVYTLVASNALGLAKQSFLVTVNGPPLGHSRSGSNVILSWSDPSFVLEQSLSLSPTAWTFFGSNSPVSIPVGFGPKSFFRLRK